MSAACLLTSDPAIPIATPVGSTRNHHLSKLASSAASILPNSAQRAPAGQHAAAATAQRQSSKDAV
jgi:hypothetical protein